MLVFGLLTAASTLIISSFVTGFFLSAFGPTHAETCYLITEKRQHTFAYGYLLIACGTGWLLGAPAAGQAVAFKMKYSTKYQTYSILNVRVACSREGNFF